MTTTERITAVRRQLVHRQGGKYARCGKAMGDDVHIARIRTISVGGGPALVSAGNMVATHLTFHSLPDAMPFLVRLTMMVVTQVALGKALQREAGR